MGRTNARGQRVGVLLALGVLGSTVFLLGSGMPPYDPSAEKLDPPGDCDRQTYGVLKEAVKKACKGDSRPPRCDPSDDCEALIKKTLAFDDCFKARLARETKCFRGGNEGHRKEMQGMINGRDKCIEFVAAKKCLPEQQPPTCQSTEDEQPWTE